MMRQRLTYVTADAAKQFEDFIIEQSEDLTDTVRVRAKEYNTFSLLKLLYQVQKGPQTFSNLYRASKIRMKKSFINYLHFCVDYDFMKREVDGRSVQYSITDKGTTMLNLFTK